MAINFRRFGDSFESLLTGLGVWGRDRTRSMRPHLGEDENLTQNQAALDILYRTDWVARKIVDIPAFDATRAWRQWSGTQGQIEALKNTEKAFGMQRKMLSGLTKSRLYGGAAMILGVNDGPFQTELNLNKVGKGDLKFVHVVEKWQLAAGTPVRDITSPWFGEPNYYMRSNTPILEAPGNVQPLKTSGLSPANNANSDVIYIHPSRVVRLVGLDYPDIEHAPDAWGDSVLMPVYRALREAGLVSSSLANLVSDMKVDVYKIPGLTSTLSTSDGTQQFMNYLTNANAAKSVLNSLVMDKEFEWDRVESHFEGMPNVLNAFLLIAAAAADIPSTRMLSREPAGMNSTGDSDTRNYYDRLHADQNVRVTPIMSRLDEVLIRTTFGTRDPAITYDWNSLWQMSDTEKADIQLKKAQAFQIDNNSGLMPPAALAVGRENQLIQDNVYPGFDQALDDWQEEQDLAELNDPPEPEPKPNPKPDNDNPDEDEDDKPESQNPNQAQAKTADEDTGHAFRGNQYTEGQSGAAKAPVAGEYPRGQVREVMKGRIAHSKYEYYARAARLMAKHRDTKSKAAAEAAIREAYYKNGAEAKRFANEPLSHKVLDSVVKYFTSLHHELGAGMAEQSGSKASKVAGFATEHIVGIAHELALDHVILPAIETALVAGLAEFGMPEGAVAVVASAEVVHYAVKRIVEHSPLSADHAVEVLKQTTHALSVSWRAKLHHAHDGLTDAQSYENMLTALDRFSEALDQYSELAKETTQ